MTLPAARSLEQRIQDSRARFEKDDDTWVSTGGDKGPYLVPLSFYWDGAAFVITTVSKAMTARNLVENGKVHLAFGPTRDVTIVEGSAVLVPEAEVASGLATAYAERTGWDPREEEGDYLWFRITPRRIRAWREVNELVGRDLMKQGQWLG